MRSFHFVALAALVFIIPSQADAWRGLGGKWCRPVDYALNNRGSADLGVAETERLVRQAYETWAGVSCTGLQLNWQGQTANGTGPFNGSSVIAWVESGWRQDPRVIGATLVPSGVACYSECDMDMNGVNYTWIDGPGRGDTVDALSILLHEGGHWIGFDHSADRNANMFASYAGGRVLLNSDDQTGVCTLYPGGDGPAPDCSEVGCSAGQTCDTTTSPPRCVTPTGDGSICARCEDSSDCGGANDFCLEYPDGIGYCAKACSGQPNECGADGRCFDLGLPAPQCLGVDAATMSISCAGRGGGATPTPECTNDTQCGAGRRCNTSNMCEDLPMVGAALGESCAGNDACQSGLCLLGQCSQSCDRTNVGSCPGGFYCNADATSACGDGFCSRGVAGAGAEGTACAQDTECQSLYCTAEGVCGTYCEPGGTIACPTGTTCRSLEDLSRGCGVCDADAKGLGEPCTMSNECTTPFCATQGDTGWCSQFCSDTEPCPTGHDCVAVDETRSICRPAGGAMPPTMGQLGDACTDNPDCVSGLCACRGDDCWCTNICADNTDCAGTFECQPAGDVSVCEAAGGSGGRDDGNGDCCSVAGSGGPKKGFFAVMLIVGGLLLRRRRK